MNDIWPAETDLDELFRCHYGDPMRHGWRVKMAHRFGYFSTDRWYEAVVDRLVTPGCRWVDVGGGRHVFPNNPELARELAGRCAFLLAVDPSDNVGDNSLAHDRRQSTIEDFTSDETFDLATLRMVAEHFQHPERSVASLSGLIKPGGHVVIYTPSIWSPLSLAAMIIPNRWHYHLTKLLWDTREKDVFPTYYRMNSRARLRSLFREGGFSEVVFAYLDSCSTWQRYRWTCYAEMSVWRVFRALGLRYLEHNILAIYRRD